MKTFKSITIMVISVALVGCLSQQEMQLRRAKYEQQKKEDDQIQKNCDDAVLAYYNRVEALASSYSASGESPSEIAEAVSVMCYPELSKYKEHAASVGKLCFRNLIAHSYSKSPNYYYALIDRNVQESAAWLENNGKKRTIATVINKRMKAKEPNQQKQEPKVAHQADTPHSTGSGFVISPDGYFLTCAHIVQEGRAIKVRLGAKTYPAMLVRADAHNDVALLKLDGADFQPLAISQSLPEMGDKVFTVGFPNPEIQGSSAKYTDGSISSLSGVMDDIRTMQITVPIQEGNSGGALVDAAGNVIGFVVAQLNAATVFEYTGSIPQNVNFAVKINYALPLVQAVPGLAKSLPQPRSPISNARPVDNVQVATGLVLVYE